MPQPTDRIKNGDETTLTAALAYGQGPLVLQGSASYSWDQDSYIDELGVTVNHYQTGPRTALSGFASYAWSPKWSSTLSLLWTHTGNNKIIDATGSFVTEPFNSNNDVFRSDTGLVYLFDKPMSRQAVFPGDPFAPEKTYRIITGFARAGIGSSALDDDPWCRPRDGAGQRRQSG